MSGSELIERLFSNNRIPTDAAIQKFFDARKNARERAFRERYPLSEIGWVDSPPDFEEPGPDEALPELPPADEAEFIRREERQQLADTNLAEHWLCEHALSRARGLRQKAKEAEEERQRLEALRRREEAEAKRLREEAEATERLRLAAEAAAEKERMAEAARAASPARALCEAACGTGYVLVVQVWEAFLEHSNVGWPPIVFGSVADTISTNKWPTEIYEAIEVDRPSPDDKSSWNLVCLAMAKADTVDTWDLEDSALLVGDDQAGYCSSQRVVVDPALIHRLLETLESDTRARWRPSRFASAEEFVAACGKADTTLTNLMEDLSACGFDVALLNKLKNQPEPQPIEFLVPGLIQKGAVTLLVGPPSAGKSTLMTELADTVGAGGGSWAGYDIPAAACDGFALLFCGEDNRAVIDERFRRLSGEKVKRVFFAGNEVNDLFAELKQFAPAKVSLVVVDPARLFYQGDEDGSDAVSAFFTRLNSFATEKNCAIVLTHHIKKGVRPTTLADLASNIRGSSVFIDRPRAILGLLSRGDESLFGFPPFNGAPKVNLPHELLDLEPRTLLRDSATHRHVRKAAKSVAPAVFDDTSATTVLKAIRDGVSAGRKVTKTGPNALKVEGLSRATIRAAIAGLLARASIVAADDGGLTLP